MPYSGAAPALKDLLGGQVLMGMLNLAATHPFIEQGKLKALAYGGAKRSGIGREGVRYAIRDLTEERMVVVDPR